MDRAGDLFISCCQIQCEFCEHSPAACTADVEIQCHVSSNVTFDKLRNIFYALTTKILKCTYLLTVKNDETKYLKIRCPPS